VKTHKGTFVADVPSGASTGAHEACEMRDGGRWVLAAGCRGIGLFVCSRQLLGRTLGAGQEGEGKGSSSACGWKKAKVGRGGRVADVLLRRCHSGCAARVLNPVQREC